MTTPAAIVDLGELGVVDAILAPIDMTMYRDGAPWNLTGYSVDAVVVWDLRTRTNVGAPGTAVVVSGSETAGLVRWTPGVDVYAESGAYEGRVVLDPGGSLPLQPAGLFRFSIGEK